jgi:hypothetical protein
MDPELLRQTSGADYVIAWAWGVFLGLSILLWPTKPDTRKALLVIWGAKLVVTLGVMLAYEANYPLDAYHYFLSGQFAPRPWDEVTLGNGTEVMEFLSGVHSAVLPISYHAEKVSCAYLGLVGVFQFYIAARTYWSRLDERALYALALFPSVLFWSSILGKDPIVLLGIGVFVNGIVQWNVRHRTIGLVYAAAGVALAAVIRSWLGAIIVGPLLVFAFLRVRSFWARSFFLAVVAIGLVIVLRFGLEALNAESTDDLLEISNSVSHSWQGGGSGQQLDTEFTSVGSIVAFLPLGMFTALFRPLPGEGTSAFAFIASIENGLMLLLVIRAAARLRWSDVREPMILWLLAFILGWSAVYGLVAYQNLGTAIRFRLQIEPVLLGVVLYLGRPRGTEWHGARIVADGANATPARPLATSRHPLRAPRSPAAS